MSRMSGFGVAPGRAPGAREAPTGRWRAPLAAGAATTVAAGVASDLFAGEHPTHTLGLALVAAVTLVLHRHLTGRGSGLFTAVAATLVLQPVLHAISNVGGLGQDPVGDGVLHVLGADAPAAAVQVAVSAAALVAVVVLARCTGLLDGVLGDPARLLASGPPVPAEQVTVRVRTSPLGSTPPCRGWAVRSPRRGPPAPRLR